MKKSEMKQYILSVAQNDTDFLMNSLKGVDILMDAVEKAINKMDKKELKKYCEIAKDSKYQPQ